MDQQGLLKLTCAYLNLNKPSGRSVNMPRERRCLAPGCSCPGYVMEMRNYDQTDEFLEGDVSELRAFCSRCGHAEEEHELAPTD
jgi:hypothetical protein